MTIAKGAVFVTNLLEEALGLWMQKLAFPGKYQWDQYYYTVSTWTNLQSLSDWMTQSLQTMNTNVASVIDQSTDFVADLIGHPPPDGNLVPYPRGTLNERFDYIEQLLNTMSNDMKEIGEAIGTQKPNRGKASKKSKKKKNNLFDQAKVVDEESDGPGRDRLLRTSLGRQIEEAKIEPQNEKIGRLENKLDTVAALQNEKMDNLERKVDKVAASQNAQNEKMDNLERKVDALSSLMMQLLDATQQE